MDDLIEGIANFLWNLFLWIVCPIAAAILLSILAASVLVMIQPVAEGGLW